jgi:threonine synthase
MDCIKKLNQDNNYIADPHTAIGYLGLKKYLQENNLRNCNGLFVSTAHPIKFKDTVENSINSKIEYPDSIRSIMKKEKSTLTMKSYSELKEYLIQKD